MTVLSAANQLSHFSQVLNDQADIHHYAVDLKRTFGQTVSY
jgi:hypothetical protein